MTCRTLVPILIHRGREDGSSAPPFHKPQETEIAQWLAGRRGPSFSKAELLPSILSRQIRLTLVQTKSKANASELCSDPQTSSPVGGAVHPVCCAVCLPTALG